MSGRGHCRVRVRCSLVLALVAPSFFAPAHLRDLLVGQAPTLRARLRHDRGHRRATDRHLHRIAVRDLRHGRRSAGARGLADAACGRRGDGRRRGPGRGQRRARRTRRVCPRSSSPWRRWWRGGKGCGGRPKACGCRTCRPAFSGSASDRRAVVSAWSLDGCGRSARRVRGCWRTPLPVVRSTRPGSDAEAARLVGVRPRAVICASFVVMGALTGLAAGAGVGAVHRRAGQRRRRARAAGDCRGRRRRHGDLRRTRARWSARSSASRCWRRSVRRWRFSAPTPTGIARCRALIILVAVSADAVDAPWQQSCPMPPPDAPNHLGSPTSVPRPEFGARPGPESAPERRLTRASERDGARRSAVRRDRGLRRARSPTSSPLGQRRRDRARVGGGEPARPGADAGHPHRRHRPLGRLAARPLGGRASARPGAMRGLPIGAGGARGDRRRRSRAAR